MGEKLLRYLHNFIEDKVYLIQNGAKKIEKLFLRFL